MVWYRELSVEDTKASPLSETTGVDERKPTSRNKGMRRPDDHEANGSGPLQSQLAAGILLGILAFVLAILLRSGASANLVHEVFPIDGATVNPYANISTNFDEQKIVKLSDSRLPRSRLEKMRAPSLLAGVFNSLWPGDMAQPLDNALTHEMGNWVAVKGDHLTCASSSLCRATRSSGPAPQSPTSWTEAYTSTFTARFVGCSSIFTTLRWR